MHTSWALLAAQGEEGGPSETGPGNPCSRSVSPRDMVAKYTCAGGSPSCRHRSSSRSCGNSGRAAAISTEHVRPILGRHRDGADAGEAERTTIGVTKRDAGDDRSGMTGDPTKRPGSSGFPPTRGDRPAPDSDPAMTAPGPWTGALPLHPRALVVIPTYNER